MHKMKRTITSCLLLAFIASAAPLHADQCEDLYEQAKEALSTVKEAEAQKDYQGIIDTYNQAADYYEQIEAVGNCRHPDMLQVAAEKARHYRDESTRLTNDLSLKQQFDEAAEQFSQGREYVKNKEWGMALINFESAIAMWDALAAQELGSKDGKVAAEAAKMARSAAEQARTFQKLNIE